jgi:protein arginine N-methyltransferase 1
VSLVINEHRHYLADSIRLAAFERAIAAIVRPGDIVLDLGSGTGVLGLLAARAGASRIYALEATAVSGLARQIAAANGFADRVTVVRGLSTWVTLPEQADVLITDQIGNFGVEAGLFEYLSDARRRLLKPNALTIPSRLTWMVAPVECPQVRGWVSFWEQPRAGLDFSPVSRPARSSGYPVVLDAAALLAEAQPLASAPPDTPPPSGLVAGEVSCVIDRAGTLDGVGGWFVAELAPGIAFTNSPNAPERIDRGQIVLPIAPIDVVAGDLVRIRVRLRPTSLMTEWRVIVTNAAGVERANCRRSTFDGMLLASEDLQRNAATARPVLSPRGRARRLALELCDGSHTVAEIERGVRGAFGDVLATEEDAAAFVADVLSADVV